MSGTAVEIKGLSKSFGAVRALGGVDFDVAANAFVSLLGASGCGKSTLLRIIAGFETPSAGRVRIFGQDVTDLPPDRRPTNLVFQRGALFPHMTVRENIGYCLRLRRWPRARINSRVDQLLALVRLEGFGDRRPDQLSGGQSQRVSLARALAAEPRVLLLDEPLSALDLKLRQQMQLELRAIQRELGATFVFVTHDQTEALVMSDRIAVMETGRIVQYGTPREIYRRPASVFVSNFIGQTNLWHGAVAAMEEGLAVVEAGAHRFLVAQTVPPLPIGTRATVSVRPEAIRLLDPGIPTPRGRSVAGQVADIIYQGSVTRAGVRLIDGQIVWTELRDDEAEGLAPGQDVTVAWPQAAATLLKGETS